MITIVFVSNSFLIHIIYNFTYQAETGQVTLLSRRPPHVDDKIRRDLDYEPFIIRFPGGSSNTISEDYCKGIMTDLVKEVQIEGYKYVDWNVDSTDASGNNVSAKKLIKSVKKNCDLEKANVILMHDSNAKKTTAKALPKIIEWAQKEGYVFKALTLDSPSAHHRVNN